MLDDIPLIGSTFKGKYEIEERLASGAKGDVYRALHLFMERRVVIKFIRIASLIEDGNVEYFKQELRAIGRLQHPNLVNIFDFGSAAGLFYIVMEYLEGSTLRERLNSTKILSSKEILKIAFQLGSAIDAAHKCGIIHTALNPEAIFLHTDNGIETVKALDFGIARFLRQYSESSTGTAADSAMEDSRYMSPERQRNDPFSPCDDIYSLGAIVSEMLTGSLLVQSDSSDSDRSTNSGVLWAIEHAFSEDPDKRPKSALEFVKELQKAADDNSSSESALASICSNSKCNNPHPDKTGRCLNCQALVTGKLVRNRFEVREMIGKGGFGATYIVLDQDCFNEVRVLKELSLAQSESNIENIENTENYDVGKLFKREAQVLLNLNHPGIPKLQAFFIEDERPYLVLDYIPGRTILAELKDRGAPFEESEARDLLMELANILDYLHTCDPPIIHRDIKPQNLLRHIDGRLFLIDFGAVSQTAGTNLSQTFIGSPGYAAPEQLFGNAVPQSDLYAAGATIIHLLTGLSPNRLFDKNTMRLNWKSKVKVSAEFGSIIRDLLVQNPDDRLANVNELKRRLIESKGKTGSKRRTSAIRPKETLAIRPMKTGSSETALSSSADSTPSQTATKRRKSEDASDTMYYEEAQESYRAAVPPMDAGLLLQTPLIHLLRRFCQERFSGQLTCLGDGIKTIYFDNGVIVFARSTLKKEHLGEMLVSVGRISQADFDRASLIMESRRIRFGKALIEMGSLTAETLRPMVIAQVSTIVYSLFEWQEGRYEIRSGYPPDEPIKLSLSTSEVIFESLRRLKEIDFIKRMLGGVRRKFSAAADPFMLFQPVNFASREALIISRIDRAISVQELLALEELPEIDVLKIACALIFSGIAQWHDERNKSIRSDITLADILGESPPPTNFDIRAAAEFCYETDNLLRQIESANFYAILGLERNEDGMAIKRAYIRIAKRFHPNGHARIIEADPKMRSTLDKIFASASEAYRTLSDPEARREYNRNLQRPFRNITTKN